MSDDMSYDEASKRVALLKLFYLHATIYVLVIILLFVINMLTSPDYWWFLFALFGWGAAVAVHGLWATRARGILDGNWEEQKIREFTSDADKSEKLGNSK